MQLVINIDDDLYKSIIGHRYKNTYQQKCDYEDLKNAIEDGVPLPKGHGRLGDLDKLEKEIDGGIKAGLMIEGYENYSNINDVDDCLECVKYADAIIEADRSEEE